MNRVSVATPDEVRDVLQAALTVKTDTSGKYSIDGLMNQGLCFKITDTAGKIHGAYVLKADGPELWVLAAAGKADIDLTAAIACALDQQGRQFDSIGFQTARKGLVKKAQKLGYVIDGYIMRKKLK